jgi:sulfate adenylyltransferase
VVDIACDETLAAVVALLCAGGFGDTRRFLDPAEERAVRSTHRLPDGTPCPVAPLCAVEPTADLLPGATAVLRDGEGNPLARLAVSAVSHRSERLVQVAGDVAGAAELGSLPEQVAIASYDADPAAVARLGVAVQFAVPPVQVDDPRPRQWLAGMQRAVVEQVTPLVTPWCGRDVTELAHQAQAAMVRGATALLLPPTAVDVVGGLFPSLRINESPELSEVRSPATGPGLTVFFTGLSGSGKSTIARALVHRLIAAGRTVTLFDGDVVRTHLSRGLGFSKTDRDVNIRRIGYVAAEITKHGGVAVCAPIAPYDATRRAVRAMVERYGRFVLVHVSTPLDVCEARDPKGLYARARSGEIPEFTGVSDPYEEPRDAQIVIDASVLSVDSAVEAVFAALD